MDARVILASIYLSLALAIYVWWLVLEKPRRLADHLTNIPIAFLWPVTLLPVLARSVVDPFLAGMAMGSIEPLIDRGRPALLEDLDSLPRVHRLVVDRFFRALADAHRRPRFEASFWRQYGAVMQRRGEGPWLLAHRKAQVYALYAEWTHARKSS